MEIARPGPHFCVEARHGFEIVVEHIRPGRDHGFDRPLLAQEIGDQHLDPGLGRALANRTDAIDEMTGTAVAQVVAVDAGDHDV